MPSLVESTPQKCQSRPRNRGSRGRVRAQVPSLAAAASVATALCCSALLCEAFSCTAKTGVSLPPLSRISSRCLPLSATKTDAIFEALESIKDSFVPFNGDNASMLPLVTKLRGPEASFDEEDRIYGLPRESVASPLALLLLSQFILFIGVGAVIPTIPLYGKEIGLSASANGIVISAPAVALLLLANFAGQYADKARKPAMLGGMALIAVSDVGTAVSTSLPPLFLARLGLGAGRAVAESGERGMLADFASRVPELRGKILAAQQAALALGIAIGAPLGGVIVERYGPRASFLCVSAAAIVALVFYLFLPETVISSEPENSFDGDDSFGGAGDWTVLLQDDKWKGLALCQIGLSFTFAAKISSIPLLATEYLPGGAVGAGALISAAGLSGLIGAPLGGWLTDRTGARATAITSATIVGLSLILVPCALSPRTNLLLPSLDGNAFGIDGVVVSGQAAVFAGLVILWSIAAAAQGPALTAVAQELAPPGAEAKSLALPRAAGDGTYIVAPFVLGLATDRYSETAPGIACAVAGGMMIFGALALTILGRPSRQ